MAGRAIEIVMEEVTDASELEQAQRQRAQFDLNSAWLQEHISKIYSKHRGRNICISGQEVFTAKTAEDAIAAATAAHPHDQGWFTRYIPLEKVARIYAV